MGDERIGHVSGNVLSSTLVKAKVRKDNTEQRKELGFRTDQVKAFSQLTGFPEAGMVLWNCPKLGEGDWAFMLLC